MLSYAFLQQFRNALCVTLFFKCVTPFFEHLSINGNSLDFGRPNEKNANTPEPLQLEYEGHDDYTYTIDIKFDSEDDWRLARANGVVPYYFVIEP